MAPQRLPWSEEVLGPAAGRRNHPGTSNGVSSVVVVAKAGRLRGQKLVIEVLGVPRDPGSRAAGDEPAATEERDRKQIWAGLLQPDALDEINQTVSVPVVPTRWKGLSVRYCTVGDDYSQLPKCDDPDSEEGSNRSTSTLSVVAVRNRAAEDKIGQISAHISPAGDGKLQAKFIASDVAPGVLTRIELCRAHAGKHTNHVTDATLAPDLNGLVTWEATVPAGMAGDRLLLRHSACPPGTRCNENWRTVATFVQE